MLSAFPKAAPYLFGSVGILVETLAIRRDLYGLSLVTLDNTGQEIPERREPQIMANLSLVQGVRGDLSFPLVKNGNEKFP
jgi:hypothetical protein